MNAARSISCETLTHAGSRVIAQQPPWRAETLCLAQILIKSDATEVAAAAADRRDNVNLASPVVYPWLEVSVHKLVTRVRVTALAVR